MNFMEKFLSITLGLLVLLLILAIFEGCREYAREEALPPVKAVVTKLVADEIWVISEENRGGIQHIKNMDASIKPLLDVGTIVMWKKNRGIQSVLVSTAGFDKKNVRVTIKNKYAEILAEIKDPQARIRFEDTLTNMLENGKL